MRKVGILTKLNYQAGLLSDVEVVEGVVATPEEQVEIIANSAETIVPQEAAETEALLNEIVTEDEIIEDELAEVQEEQVAVAEGLQSDFTAVTTRSMIKSIERLNKRYGKDSISTAGMQSDRHGGDKALYIAGLQAKESFLKDAGKNIMALIASFVEKIKELASKVVTFLNNDKKAAESILKAIAAKNNKFKEGFNGKLTDSEKTSIGNKFGAWLALGGTLEDYPLTMSKALEGYVIPNAKFIADASIAGPDKLKKVFTESRVELDKLIRSSSFLVKDLDTKEDQAFGISILGKNVKVLTVKDIENFKAVVENVQIPEDKITDAVKAIENVPGLDILKTHAEAAKKMADRMKSRASSSWKNLESYKELIKKTSAEDASYASIKSAAIIANQITLADLSAYTGTQKTMIWLAATFVNKFEGTDAKPEEKK